VKTQTRRGFIRSTAAASAALAVASQLGISGCSGAKISRPNVILVMTDDQGYGDLGCHGSPYVKTPALDQLYGESIRLTDFHVDPCCSPTRASLLTGQYSARSGVWHTIGGRSLLQKDKVTMADIFRSSGYRTGIFGKWHLGQNYPFRPHDRGFDEALVHGSGGIGNRWDYGGNDYFDDTYLRNGEPEKFEGYCNSVWFDEAIKFIRRNEAQPFFCFVSTNVPHAPLTVDDEYAEPYRGELSDRLANYYGMVSKFDEDMTRLLIDLKKSGQDENTILIFLTDNGPCPWFGGIKIDDDGYPVEGYSVGMRGGKIWGYENAHRVPCFIRWPAGGIGDGKDIDTLSAHFDLLPTLIDCCDLKKPPEVTFDGVSLLPLLKDSETTMKERSIIVHNQRVDFPVKYKEYEVLTERWRLINPYGKEIEDMESFNSGKPSYKVSYMTVPDAYELYDITRDPEQKHNVAADHPEIVAELKEKYETWWADVSPGFDTYPQSIVGSDQQNPTTLYSHDTHRKGRDSIWVIDVAQDGKYEIGLSRWPQEADKRIAETRKGDTLIDIPKAGIKIGNSIQSVEVSPGMKSARFIVNLKAGTTCLQGWFTGKLKGRKIRAEFVSVERLGPADPAVLDSYRATDPNRLLKG